MYGRLQTQRPKSRSAVSLHSPIKNQYKCIVKLVEAMESAKCTGKEAVQAIRKFVFSEDFRSTNRYSKNNPKQR